MDGFSRAAGGGDGAEPSPEGGEGSGPVKPSMAAVSFRANSPPMVVSAPAAASQSGAGGRRCQDQSGWFVGGVSSIKLRLEIRFFPLPCRTFPLIAAPSLSAGEPADFREANRARAFPNENLSSTELVLCEPTQSFPEPSFCGLFPHDSGNQPM
jgi:hypothetical protein